MDWTDEIASLLEKFQNQTVQWVHEFNLLLVDTANNYLEYSTKDHAKYDLPNTGARVLYAILSSGGRTTQKRITKTIPISKQAIAVVISELETKSLIEKRIESRDHRKREILITEKGINLLKEILPIRASFYKNAEPLLSEEEIKQAMSVLHKINVFYKNNIKKLDKRKENIKSNKP